MSALRFVSPALDSCPRGRVLLIDDDADLLGLMDHAFSAAGYATRTAENGRKGLSMLDAYDPDLVVTDCSLSSLRIGQENKVSPLHPVEALARAYGLIDDASDVKERS